MVWPRGTCFPPGSWRGCAASKAQKKAARKARKLAAKQSTQRAGESLKARVDRAVAEALARPGVREALTAGKAPQPAPGAGQARGLEGGDSGLLAALSVGMDSPYYRMPGVTTVGSAKAARAAASSEVDLATMGPDELRDYAAGVFKADADARGFGSPAWQ
jgi:hypothetical protein